MSGGPSLTTFLAALASDEPLTTVELRPPASDLDTDGSMDAWIDIHHAVRRFTNAGRYVLMTDNAVGASEEENLAHLSANLDERTDPGRLVPFLTCNHSLEHCLVYAERALAAGIGAVTVVGGDRSGTTPRCVPHAYLLRRRIRARVPALSLGGWANPHREPERQVDYLARSADETDYFLTQIVSHHSVDRAAAFLDALAKSAPGLGGAFGVFYYRSARPSTLRTLDRFFPVPAEELSAEFAAGDSPERICARSIRALREVGARHVYVSNLGLRRPDALLERILELV